MSRGLSFLKRTWETHYGVVVKGLEFCKACIQGRKKKVTCLVPHCSDFQRVTANTLNAHVGHSMADSLFWYRLTHH
jgi:hypothetical protein